ncbi:MAG: T9SS type A sorting domain-containing protein [Chitinophagaceae bacterium]
MRYPYFNLLENDSMGMIVQLKSCKVKPGYIIAETGLIKYYYENFYLIVDAPPASSDKIQLYPNPSTGVNHTTLVVPMTGSHRLTVSVKDLNGHNLFLSGFACQDSFAGTLPSGYWPAGIYLVTVFIDDVPQPTIKLIR